MTVFNSKEVRYKAKNIIESMSEETFEQKFLQDVSRTEEFGLLITYYAEYLSSEEKSRVREVLHRLGIPYELMSTDAELDDVAVAAMDRVNLRL